MASTSTQMRVENPDILRHISSRVASTGSVKGCAKANPAHDSPSEAGV
jgi:hypothetical protein